MTDTQRPSQGAKAPTPRVIRGLDAEQRKQQRRDALLDAALDLFAAQGFVGTSIEQICNHAYVGTKGFYETFTSRDDLYSALLQRVTDTALGRMAELFESIGPDVEEEAATSRLIEEFAHEFVDDVRLAKVTFGEGSAITPAAERQRRGNRRLAAAFLESIWARYGHEISEGHHGVAIGVIGGLFDIVADWVLDLEAETASEAEKAVAIARLQNFYAAIRRGL